MDRNVKFFILTTLLVLISSCRFSQAITGFRNVPDPTHSLTFTQQGQILSDVQQHQHRFGIQSIPGDGLIAAQTQNFLPRQPFAPEQPFFIQQPQQLLIQPPIINGESPFLPSQPNPPIVQPHLIQQNLPAIQQAQPFFRQPQINGHQQQIPTGQPLPTQNSFLPTIPPQETSDLKPFPDRRFPTTTTTLRQNNAEIGFQSSLGGNPLFSRDQNTQVQTLLEQQRKQDLERLKDLEERQKIIQKHQQFVERQQQKQQQKVRKLHEEFVLKQKKKQEEIYATAKPETDSIYRVQTKQRGILPQEAQLFEKAVKDYELLHPTTTISTTTTTTASTTTPRPKSRNVQRAKSRSETENRDVFVHGNRQKLYKELKSILQNADDADSNDQQTVSPSKLQFIQKQDLLKQLKLAIAENSADLINKNYTSREISLPNGQKVEVIRTTDPNLIAGATPLSADGSSLTQIVSSPNQIRTSARQKMSFEDLTKGVIPPGADFQLIKQSDGKLEEVDQLPPNISGDKKLTFVFIEEQGDGSFKVKGVRGNGDEDKNAQNVDAIISKIKNGEINLPPSSNKNAGVSSTKAPTTISRQNTFLKSTLTNDAATIYDDFEATKINKPVTPASVYFNSPSISVSSSPTPSPSSLSIEHNGSPTTPSYKSQSSTSTLYSKMPTSPINGHQMYTASTSATRSSDTVSIISSPSTYYPPTNLAIRSTTTKPTDDSALSLVDILKENGLFATAKYLKQSGLDTILNETGPYTVFAPTDKAFRTLLVQLGGPDKAEEKFKENPRLLSGLLLHHVIPGAFEISSLQDEMTGVSLAGTQLRVNQYDMHDVEWNEIKVTTVNGARVISEKQDIAIPQGIAHAVDRVMFPLPVGDIIQTLQADRERRFTNFLKALFSSGITETLSDSRTYTVFAPTDRAFSFLTSDELAKIVTDKEKSKELVTKHITPGTLFSAGMRYYQVRDSMEEGKPITLQKNAGRVKVNSGHVVTHNIPATNGVIHAVDALL